MVCSGVAVRRTSLRRFWVVWLCVAVLAPPIVLAARGLPAEAAESVKVTAGAVTAPVAFTSNASTDTTGRDLAVSSPLSDGRRLWAMGDTFESVPFQSGLHSTTAAFTN